MGHFCLGLVEGLIVLVYNTSGFRSILSIWYLIFGTHKPGQPSLGNLHYYINFRAQNRLFCLFLACHTAQLIVTIGIDKYIHYLFICAHSSFTCPIYIYSPHHVGYPGNQ